MRQSKDKNRFQKQTRKTQQPTNYKSRNEQLLDQLEQLRQDNYPKKSKPKKTTNKSRKTKPQSDQSVADQSQQSQIIDIRNSDESTREHVRPSFLKRWDGVSNELELTQNEMKAISPMLQAYWKVKSKNMNVIVFLQFGKMQFLAFEDDALKLNEMFKKKIKKFSKFMMVNFWYKEIQAAKKELFNQNIPVMVMNEIDDPQYRQQNGIVRRQVVQVQTPGLHLNIKDATFKERLVVALFKSGTRFGVAVLDGESNHFYVEECEDDEYLHQIRRVINRYRPVQVVLPDKNHKQIAQIFKQICNPYIVELNLRIGSLASTLSKFQSFNTSLLFKRLVRMYEAQNPTSDDKFSRFHTASVLALICQYLESLSLCQKIFCQGLFQENSYDKATSKPFFDSQVYENLQIFSIKNQEEGYGQPGTLICYLDKCRTVQGKKMLHKWVDQPLQSLREIQERQQAVQELVENCSFVLDLHDNLKIYAKFESRIADIYHWVIRNSEKGKLTLTKQINYEKQYDQRKNPAIMRLQQIVQILKLFKDYESFLKELRNHNLKSKYLQKQVQLIQIPNIHIMPLEEINKIEGLPQIGYVAQSIMRNFNLENENLQPAPGLNQIFDHQKQQIEAINRDLNQELQKWKKYFNNEKVTFVSIRAKNQVQVPKSSIKSKVHPDLIFSSQTSTAIRYTTPRTYQLSEQLIEHQTIISQTFQPFLQDVVLQFCSFRYLWDIYVQSIAKIDVLMSLAQVSKAMTPRCLPQFNESRLFIKKGYHASLKEVKENIIPNTLNLNKNERLLLLTGPNMGGKSTLLKQTCILAVMAQIGSYVPAEEYHSIIFDQIFCRIGASDRIYQGKSTFYVQLEQTKRIINQATSSSLIIIDELGRGTSTYDGMAIAEATMDYLLKQVGAFTLFSTHYSQITKKFQNTPEVKLMKMSSELAGEDLTFTYQLVEGVAERSFAGNVGKMVGIAPQILRRAESKSEQMHHETRKKKILRQAYLLVHSLPFNRQKRRINHKALIQE